MSLALAIFVVAYDEKPWNGVMCATALDMFISVASEVALAMKAVVML